MFGGAGNDVSVWAGGDGSEIGRCAEVDGPDPRIGSSGDFTGENVQWRFAGQEDSRARSTD